jgi:hypothetical protein
MKKSKNVSKELQIFFWAGILTALLTIFVSSLFAVAALPLSARAFFLTYDSSVKGQYYITRLRVAIVAVVAGTLLLVIKF